MCSSHSSTSARNAPSAPPSSVLPPPGADAGAGEVVGVVMLVGVVVGVDGGCILGEDAADALDGIGEVEGRRRCSGGVGMGREADMAVRQFRAGGDFLEGDDDGDATR